MGWHVSLIFLVPYKFDTINAKECAELIEKKIRKRSQPIYITISGRENYL
jgi:anti-anti-sigma regulatory factor